MSSGSEAGPSTPRTTETLEHRDLGDEMETGTQPWIMVNAKNTPGSLEINPDANTMGPAIRLGLAKLPDHTIQG